ncbi:GNAT family N-acetyltransferase [Lentzea nigeriaca]|uniref:GNAT family N-acetyltransferase n=1 Tax=Lentzea nigeriaca TaxID=1128665 RepID=UPI001EF85072|nr:GNAT family N-acetyltransferase [Lentzea nigeriaca]MBM7863778.1 lysine/ornithine N-monooxygenase/RimJ/RimL family protein N-acetyltransferase [Lentzea nigeriaca]
MTYPEVDAPPLPVLPPPWSVRVLTPDDAGLVADWMNTPHVAAAWDQAWPLQRWADELARQLAGDHSLPCVASYDGRPLAYLEIYRVVRDRLAAHYPAGPHDLGVHVAIGDPQDIGRGLGSALLRAVADGLLAAEPGCSQIVAEPNVLNPASQRAFRNAGFRYAGEVVFPHKKAALLIRPRAEERTDVVGIGFGPANLALAVALAEHPGVTARFLERQDGFAWHRDMLLDGATVQVSFLKDLVTMRNPTSEYGFLSYLAAKDRLVEFINHKTLFPSRVEFNDYMSWVASRFAAQVEYGSEVVGVRPVAGASGVDEVEVVTRLGRRVRCRDLVIATGLRPVLPAGIEASDRVWHSDELLSRLEKVDSEPRRVVVLGAGQSAAEVVEYVHRRYPHAEVCAVFGRYGYSPADDSPFANGVFDPAAVDTFYGAPDAVKERVLAYHRNTNYSVVDLELIQELYRRGYQEMVIGERRLRVLNLSTVDRVGTGPDGVLLGVVSLATGERSELEADFLVCATGYREADVFGMLGELGRYCLRDDHGRPLVDRDYRVRTVPEVSCRIYLQGPTEHSHGISSGLLSTVAVRAGEIARSIVERERVAVLS